MNSLRQISQKSKSICTRCARTFTTTTPKPQDPWKTSKSPSAWLDVLESDSSKSETPGNPKLTTSPSPQRDLSALRTLMQSRPTPAARSTQPASSSRPLHKNLPTYLAELGNADLRLNVARQMPRRWRAGDVYAPHDLSKEEMTKWKRIQRRRTSDVFDMLNTDPRKHYKNLQLMSEFVSETGRIKHSSETGLRPRNQRRMAKAVRRAIGIGLMPSVYKHPELMHQQLGITDYRQER